MTAYEQKCKADKTYVPCCRLRFQFIEEKEQNRGLGIFKDITKLMAQAKENSDLCNQPSAKRNSRSGSHPGKLTVY